MTSAPEAKRRALCVFCGSATGFRPEYREVATAFGTKMAQDGWELIYGGGCIGLMGVVADACLAAGGRVTGVIPQFLSLREIRHEHLSELIVVETMHERKGLMAERSDAFVALPGGLGTFDELCEILTWAQLGLHAKPIGVLNTRNYFGGLIQQIEHAAAEGFCRPEHRHLLVVDEDAHLLLERLAVAHPPAHPKWLDADQI